MTFDIGLHELCVRVGGQAYATSIETSIVELVSVTYYISLYIGAKRLVFYLSPRDGHVIIVSGCLILTAINLIVLIRMVYITKRLVKLFKDLL